jgi:hypothetical protein
LQTLKIANPKSKISKGGQCKILHEVYPERQSEILRFAQNDSEGLRMTAWKIFPTDGNAEFAKLGFNGPMMKGSGK